MRRNSLHNLPLAYLAAASSLGVLGCSTGDERAAPRVLKVGQVLPATHPTSLAMLHFERRVEELTSGAVDVRLYSSGQLGGAEQLIVLSQLGNLEACVVSAAPLAQYSPSMNALIMPFLYRDNEHQHAVVDGDVGERLGRLLADEGMWAAAYFDAGSRNVMTMRGPINEPRDLRGMKIRVMPSAILQETVATLGAMPQAISQGEVYGALQTGVIDGWENNPATCLAYSMHETGCVNFAWTRHVAIPDLLVLSRGWVESLDEPTRDAIELAAEETKQLQRTLWRDSEREAIAALEVAGVRFNEVDQAAFSVEFDEFYSRAASEYGPEFASMLGQIRDESGGEL